MTSAEWLPAGVLAVSFLTTAAVTPAVVRFAVTRGMYDLPTGGRRIHGAPRPRIGGIAILLGTMAGLLVLALARGPDASIPSTEWALYAGVVGAAAVLFAVGLIDDVRGLSPLSKLAWQLAAAGLVYAAGFRIGTISVGDVHGVPLGAFALPITVLWIVAVTNAFNLIDGLDGLATGVALVALGSSGAVAYSLGQSDVAVICLILSGALLGFLPYNFNPAKIFLGDSGSMFIGFMLAVLSVHGAMKSATAVLAIVPLFALALPLIDMGLAMLRRWLRGVPISVGDRRHIHHRLLSLGLTHRRTVLVLYATASVMAGIGLMIALSPPDHVRVLAGLGGGASLLLVSFGVRRLEYHEFSELRSIVALGPAKLRKIIRDRIHARDLALVIAQAPSVEEVRAVLSDAADLFDFLLMEVCPESANRRSGPDAILSRAWKLDYPVLLNDSASGELLVLRIWCRADIGFRPYGAERVARIIAPAVETTLRRASSVDAPAEEHIWVRPEEQSLQVTSAPHP